MSSSEISVVAVAESWPIDGVFRISRGARTTTDLVHVELRAGDVSGHGEGSPSARYQETIEDTLQQIEALIPALSAGMDRVALSQRLPAGAARNAIDCALWDLEAKQKGTTVATLAGLQQPAAVTSAFTLSIDEPEAMGRAAANQAGRPLLKLKLAGDGADLARVSAVRENAGAATLIVDANEAWSPGDYKTLVPEFQALGVALIEQPFPTADDSILSELPHPIPVCADESCHTRDELPALAGRYDVINIKLDKTGGLTEALALKAAAAASGFGLMVGCMLGTSLAMAPALLVAQDAQFVDLDGPLLLARDREPGLRFDGSVLHPPKAQLWG